MPEVSVCLDGRKYLWTKHFWYDAENYSITPLILKQQLEALAGINLVSIRMQQNNISSPSVKAIPPARKQSVLRNQVDPIVVRQTLEAVTLKDTVRPYLYDSIEKIEELAYSNNQNLKVLIDVMLELRHRRTRRAKRFLEDVVESFVTAIGVYFPWPDTNATVGKNSLEGEYFQWESGLFKFMGYHVGRTSSLTNLARRQLLDGVYLKILPKVNNVDYMLQWGAPNTNLRLRKMAESIATFTCNAKRRQSIGMNDAISDWEDDLEYLRVNYYVGKYDFEWPLTLLR